MSPWLSDVFLSSQSDQRLVRLAQAGHQQAFAVIVERYRRELIRFAARLCPDGRSEDVVQQALLSAFAALQSGTEVHHLRGWLYTIVRRQAARAAEPAYAPAELVDIAVAGPQLEDAVADRMFAIEALSEINQLPDRQRKALVATALEGRSRAEVAGLLGLSDGAVRQLVHRARAAVRAAVTAITPFPVLRWFVSRQPGGTDWTTAELVAGAGSASGAAVAIKLGAVMAVGLGVAGAIAVRPQAVHRHHIPAAAGGSSGNGRSGQGVGRAPSALAIGPLAGKSAAASGSAVDGLVGALAPARLGGGLAVTSRGGGSVGLIGEDGGRAGPGPSGSGGEAGGSGGESSGSSGGDHGGTSGSGGTPGGPGPSSGSDGGTLSSGSSGGGGPDGGSGAPSGGGSSPGDSSGPGPASNSSDGGSTSSASTPDGGGSHGGLSGPDGGGTVPDGSTTAH